MSNAVPHGQQAQTQLVDVIYAFLICCITAHILSSTGFLSGLFGGHWSEEMKSDVSRRQSAIASRTLCAGVLSCWNMKLSPDIYLMHGNSFSFSSTSIMEIGEAIKNPAYRIFQTEYSGCLDISTHA